VDADPEARIGIQCLAAALAEGSDDFGPTEQSYALAECHFDRRRIRAARFDVFLAMADLENANADDFEKALRAMNSISRYATRAFSKSRKVLRKSTSD
jgi:hypothetical protein